MGKCARICLICPNGFRASSFLQIGLDALFCVYTNFSFVCIGCNSADEEAVATKDKDTEWQAPRWTQGLIVKPDDAQRNGQARLWGGITLAGLLFPPAIDYLNRFTWLVCIAQLSFRGMPRDNIEGGGLGISFNSGGGGKSHMKVAWLLGVGVSILGATLVYGLMPAWAKGQRYTALLAYTLRNTIFAVACSYIQPYKG